MLSVDPAASSGSYGATALIMRLASQVLPCARECPRVGRRSRCVWEDALALDLQLFDLTETVERQVAVTGLEKALNLALAVTEVVVIGAQMLARCFCAREERRDPNRPQPARFRPVCPLS
jgi:hypothetical protein